jgi:hypothetical protein
LTTKKIEKRIKEIKKELKEIAFELANGRELDGEKLLDNDFYNDIDKLETELDDLKLQLK